MIPPKVFLSLSPMRLLGLLVYLTDLYPSNQLFKQHQSLTFGKEIMKYNSTFKSINIKRDSVGTPW